MSTRNRQFAGRFLDFNRSREYQHARNRSTSQNSTLLSSSNPFPPQTNFRTAKNYFHSNPPSKPVSQHRPSTPLFLQEQPRNEIYKSELQKNIQSRTETKKAKPNFPRESKLNSSKDTLLRPSSYRPNSAKNPDFILPKDAFFYYKEQQKVFTKVDEFYGAERSAIEQMVDECLKGIITLFEDYKKKLFGVLESDKQVFLDVYSRFRDSVDAFLEASESRLENNIKTYQSRILAIQKDEQNPLNTQMERLQLDRELIDSQERIYADIIKNYQRSSIPHDKQNISNLVLDGHQELRSANRSSLGQHMQNMINGLLHSITTFTGFSQYTSTKLTPKPDESAKQVSLGVGPFANSPIHKSLNPEPLQRFSHQGSNLYMNKSQVGLNNSQLVWQQLVQMGLSSEVLQNPQILKILNAGQVGQRSLDKTGLSANFMNTNYEGAIVQPHINGNLNVNINSLQEKHWANIRSQIQPNKRIPSTPFSGKNLEESLLVSNQQTNVVKITGQPLNPFSENEMDLYGQLNGKAKKCSQTSLSQVGINNREQLVSVTPQKDSKAPTPQNPSLQNKEPEADHSFFQMQDKHSQLRTKSPILEAKETAGEYSNIYSPSRSKIMSQQTRVNESLRQLSPMESRTEFPGFKNFISKTPGSEAQFKKQTRELIKRESGFQSRTDSKKHMQRVAKPFGDAGQERKLGEFLSKSKMRSGLRAKKFPGPNKISNSLKKTSFRRDLLQPKAKARFGMGAQGFNQKYNPRPLRPASQSVKSPYSKRFKGISSLI